MENLTINVNKQFDGLTFSLTPLSRQSIQKEFPSAHPVKSIFISFDAKGDFNLLRGNIKKYIYPALTDIPGDKLSDVENVRFVDSLTNKELYSISSSHVEE